MDINIDKFNSRSVSIIDDLYRFTIINHKKIYSFEWDIKADDLYEAEKKKIVAEIEMLLGEHEHKGLTIIHNMSKYWERLHKQDKMKRLSRLYPYDSSTPNDSANINVVISNPPKLPSRFDDEYDNRFGELDNIVIPGFEPSPVPIFTINGFVIPDDFGKNRKKLGRPKSNQSNASAVDNYKFIKKYEESAEFRASVDRDEKEDEEMKKRRDEAALRPIGRPRIRPIKIKPVPPPPKPFKHPVPYPQFLNRPLDIPRDDIPLKIDTGYDVVVANNIIDKNTIDSIYAGDYDKPKVKNPRGRPEGSKNQYNYIPLNGPNGGIQALKSSNNFTKPLSSLSVNNVSDYSRLAKNKNDRIITKDVPILPTKTVINFTRENSFPNVSHLPPVTSLTAPVSSIKNKVGRPMVIKAEKPESTGKRGRQLGSRNIGPTARTDREVIIVDKEIAFSENPSSFELYVIQYSRKNRNISYAEWDHHVNKKFKECHDDLKEFLNDSLENWKELNVSMINDLKNYLMDKIREGKLEGADGEGVKQIDIECAKLHDPVYVMRANMAAARKERKEKKKNDERGNSVVVKVVDEIDSDVNEEKVNVVTVKSKTSDFVTDLINFDDDPVIPNNDNMFKDLNDVDLIDFSDDNIVLEPERKYMFNPELILTTNTCCDLYDSDSTDIHDISDSDIDIDVVNVAIDEKMEIYDKLYDTSNLIVEIYKYYREINFVANLLSVKKNDSVDDIDEMNEVDYLELD